MLKSKTIILILLSIKIVLFHFFILFLFTHSAALSSHSHPLSLNHSQTLTSLSHRRRLESKLNTADPNRRSTPPTHRLKSLLEWLKSLLVLYRSDSATLEPEIDINESKDEILNSGHDRLVRSKSDKVGGVVVCR